jgi:hypothetical protein
MRITTSAVSLYVEDREEVSHMRVLTLVPGRNV